MEGNGNDFEGRFKRLEDLVVRDNEEFRERFRRFQEGLDRIETGFGRMQHGLERIQGAHERFAEESDKEFKRLLTAQVVMHDRMEQMERNLKMQGRKLRKTEILVHEIGEKLNALVSWSEQVQRENNERFRRLEGKQ